MQIRGLVITATNCAIVNRLTSFFEDLSICYVVGIRSLNEFRAEYERRHLYSMYSTD